MKPEKSKTIAWLSALFLSPFYFIYAGKDKRFMAALILNIFFFWTFIVPIGVWIWAVEDCWKETRNKKSKFTWN